MGLRLIIGCKAGGWTLDNAMGWLRSVTSAQSSFSDETLL
jgi:hypothetical protein